MPRSGSLTDIDNLVLTRLTVSWSSSLVGLRLGSLRQENGDRFRLVFASLSAELTLITSVDPTRPWIGEAVRRWDGPRWSPDPFVVMAARALEGRSVAAVFKAPADRAIRFDFGNGRGLAIELSPHHANVVLLDEGATVVAAHRLPPSAKARLAPGQVWSGRGAPPGRLDPFRERPEALDAAVADGAALGQAPAEAVARRFVGVGSVAAEAAVTEHMASGRPLGIVLRDRLVSVVEGAAEVLIEVPDDASAELDLYPTDRSRLLPWRPDTLRPGTRLIARHTPGQTAAAYYEALDRAERIRARIVALGAILRGELARTQAAQRKVEEALQSFADPDRFRRMGEALLAGLTLARREGDAVMVPDPYDIEGREILIPAPRDKPLPQIADDLFRLQRRSRRGLESAGARAELLSRRALRLEALLLTQGAATDAADAQSLEVKIRSEGLPVGLAGPTRAKRAAAAAAAPRLAGVRMLLSMDGFTILVGRTSRDNDRLTFKIAAPDDIWLHAAGVHGAHVVIRLPDRSAPIPAATLAEAARLALWFSDARSEPASEVHWTRRKNVRRAKGGGSGQVVLKRFETLRVRAAPPKDAT